MAENNRHCYWLQGLLIDGLICTAIGLFCAPRSGKETRGEIGQKASDLEARAKEECEAALEKIRSRYNGSLKQLKQAGAA